MWKPLSYSAITVISFSTIYKPCQSETLLQKAPFWIFRLQWPEFNNSLLYASTYMWIIIKYYLWVSRISCFKYLCNTQQHHKSNVADILKAVYKYTGDTGDLLLRNKMIFLKIGTYMYLSIILTITCSFQDTKCPWVNSEENATTVPSLNYYSLHTTSFLRSH